MPNDTCKTDPDLAAVVEAWPELPEALKAGIVAMVKAARSRDTRPWVGRDVRREANPKRAYAGSNSPCTEWGREPLGKGWRRDFEPEPRSPLIVGYRRLMFEAGSHDPVSGRSGGRGEPSPAPSHPTAPAW